MKKSKKAKDEEKFRRKSFSEIGFRQKAKGQNEIKIKNTGTS